MSGAAPICGTTVPTGPPTVSPLSLSLPHPGEVNALAALLRYGPHITDRVQVQPDWFPTQRIRRAFASVMVHGLEGAWSDELADDALLVADLLDRQDRILTEEKAISELRFLGRQAARRNGARDLIATLRWAADSIENDTCPFTKSVEEVAAALKKAEAAFGGSDDTV